MRLTDFVAQYGCTIEETTDDIEKVRRGEAPRYEVFAPEGKWFGGCHSLLCDSAQDVKQSLRSNPLTDVEPE
jgi:hypothetical protein